MRGNKNSASRPRHFCAIELWRKTNLFSINVTHKVAKDRDLAIGLFLYIDTI